MHKVLKYMIVLHLKHIISNCRLTIIFYDDEGCGNFRQGLVNAVCGYCWTFKGRAICSSHTSSYRPVCPTYIYIEHNNKTHYKHLVNLKTHRTPAQTFYTFAPEGCFDAVASFALFLIWWLQHPDAVKLPYF